MYKIISILLLVNIALAADAIPQKVNLEEVSEIALSWNCRNYAEGKTFDYEEIFAKNDANLRVERWFVLAGKKMEPESRYVLIGHGSQVTLYTPCCENKTVDLDKINPSNTLLELAYGVSWWADLGRARVTDDFETGYLVYRWPYKKVYVDRSTKLPVEIRYFHLTIKYDNYVNIPGIGAIPDRVMIYDGTKLVLEKELSYTERASNALFNTRNLPFKPGDKKLDTHLQ